MVTQAAPPPLTLLSHHLTGKSLFIATFSPLDVFSPEPSLTGMRTVICLCAPFVGNLNIGFSGRDLISNSLKHHDKFIL